MSTALKQENEKYIKIYEQKMKNKVNFLSRLKIKNAYTKHEFNFNQNEEYLIKNDYMYLVYNSISLQKKFEQKNEYVAIFLTNTLDSHFHQYKQIKEDIFIKNKKYIKGNTINLGYKILSSFLKSVYKDFKVNNKYQKIEYIKVIEPHKDFTAHLHTLVFVRIEHIDSFEKHFNRKIHNNINLGQYKFEVIRDISRSASYILKYAQKNFSKENEKFKVYYGWKLENKIRAYTFTRQFIPRDMFNKLSFHLSKKFALDEDSFNAFEVNNFYEIIHKFTTFSQDIIDITTGEVSTKHKIHDEDDMFFIKLEKKRKKISNCHNAKIIEIEKALNSLNIFHIRNELKKYNLINNFNYYIQKKHSFNHEQLYSLVYIFMLYEYLNSLQGEARYSYTINDYQIYKKHHELARFDKVYDKRDWSLINLGR